MGKRPKVTCRFALEFEDDNLKSHLISVTGRGPSAKAAKRAAIARGRAEMERRLNTSKPWFRGVFSQTCAITSEGGRLPHVRRGMAGTKRRR